MERGTLGGPVHTPAWTQYCAYCCGVALVAFARLVCTWSQERLCQMTDPLRCATGFTCLLGSLGQEGNEALPHHLFSSFCAAI